MLPPKHRWIGTPVESEVTEDAVRIAAGARTDWFVDPGTSEATLSAPHSSLPQPATSSSVHTSRSAFASTFDAGALVLRHDSRTWAKLCLEYSPQAEPMVVSAVTRDVSDDCNSLVVDGNQIWLRAARIGPACALHASADGRHWQFVRHFRLAAQDNLDVGFLAQSPTGDGCAVTFSQVRFEPTTLSELRSGQ